MFKTHLSQAIGLSLSLIEWEMESQTVSEPLPPDWQKDLVRARETLKVAWRLLEGQRVPGRAVQERKQPGKRRKAQAGAALEAVRRWPELSDRELAERAGCHPRTIRSQRSKLGQETP